MLHKDSTSRILCLDDDCLAKSMLFDHPTASVVIAASRKPSLNADQDEMRVLEASSGACELENVEGFFDMVIVPKVSRVRPPILNEIRKKMTAKGHLILQGSDIKSKDWNEALVSAGFSGVELTLDEDRILSTATEVNAGTAQATPYSLGHATLIYGDEPGSLSFTMADRLRGHGWAVRSLPLHSADRVAGEAVILLLDAEHPFLASLTENGLRGLARIVENASAIVWITSGGLLTGNRPEFGMTAGAARVIRNEQGSLDLVTVDFDLEMTRNDRIVDLVLDILKRQHAKRSGETEYCIKGNAIYISRLVSHREINREFVPDSGETMVVSRSDHPALRGIMKNGRVLFNRDDARELEPLGCDDVEVDVVAMGLSASDGCDDRASLNHQVVGTVTHVGKSVASLAPGMKVTGFTLGGLETFQRTSSQLLREIPPGCSTNEAARFTSPLTTAIYGLEQLGKVEPGDFVAIVDNLGPTGLAAIQLVLTLKGNPVVITTSPATQNLLANSGLLPSKYVISSNDNDISSSLHGVTGKKGVDVLLYSGRADGSSMIQECVRNMAPLGRIVCVGRDDEIRTDIPSSKSHAEGLSYFQFDITDVIKWRPRCLSR